LVHHITNAIYEIGFVTTKDLNPSRSVGSNNAATQNPGTRPRVGSIANPSACPKFVFGNTKVKIRPSTRSLGRSLVYQV